MLIFFVINIFALARDICRPGVLIPHSPNKNNNRFRCWEHLTCGPDCGAYIICLKYSVGCSSIAANKPYLVMLIKTGTPKTKTSNFQKSKTKTKTGILETKTETGTLKTKTAFTKTQINSDLHLNKIDNYIHNHGLNY